MNVIFKSNFLRHLLKLVSAIHALGYLGDYLPTKFPIALDTSTIRYPTVSRDDVHIVVAVHGIQGVKPVNNLGILK
jgi:hypothetical protein